MNKTSKAIEWLLEDPRRSQAQAAAQFGLSQSAVSAGLKKWRKLNPGSELHDARRHRLTNSRMSQAVAWLLEDPNRTQAQAAVQFGISQSAVSAGIQKWRKRNPDDARRRRVVVSKASQAVAWLLEDQNRTQAQAAAQFGITQSTVSLALKKWRKRNPDSAYPDARRRTAHESKDDSKAAAEAAHNDASKVAAEADHNNDSKSAAEAAQPA